MTDTTNASIFDETCYQSYLGSLLTGDRHRCAAIIQDLLQREVALKSVYLDLIQRAAGKVVGIDIVVAGDGPVPAAGLVIGGGVARCADVVRGASRAQRACSPRRRALGPRR